MKKLSVEDVAQKVEWEGGVYEAIQAGLTHTMIRHQVLAASWELAENAVRATDAPVAAVEVFLQHRAAHIDDEDDDG